MGEWRRGRVGEWRRGREGEWRRVREEGRENGEGEGG